MAHTKT